MIVANEISLNLGGKQIFDHMSFRADEDQKIGLVGRNGSGKSTFLKAMAGQLALDDGTIVREKRKKIGYLPQEVVLTSDKPVLEEALTVFDEAIKIAQELEAFEKALELNKNQELTTEQLERYATLQVQVAEAEIDKLQAETKRILSGLGFKDEQLVKPVTQLSVGWRMRLVLAKLLLQKPDFYLFDEPTNHLDIVAKDWFLEFLKASSAGFILVSHDRYFLDHSVDRIFELDRGKGTLYRGNYTFYFNQKEQNEEALKVAFEQQQREIKEKMKTIERFRAKASKAGMAQSMIKALDKVERIEPPRRQGTVRISFGHVERSGKVVLKVHDLSKSFNDHPIFTGATFEIERGEKVAIVAPNGAGKTTLLNVVMGKYGSNQEHVEFGHNVTWTIFEQDQENLLNPDARIIDEVEQACTTSEARAKVRMILGTFLFPGDDAYKKIRVLSGGEKNRVAMVKVLLQDANFLMLDEPTNHLDLESKAILLEALKQYPGTLLFVSHDREFLDALSTSILELTPKGVVAYKGNYESFLYQKREREKALAGYVDPKAASGAPTKGMPVKHVVVNNNPALSGKEIFELKKKLRNFASKIARMEEELASEQEKITNLEFGSNEHLVAKQRIDKLTSEISTVYAEWESLQQKLDGSE